MSMPDLRTVVPGEDGIKLEHIVSCVTRKFGVSRDDLFSRARPNWLADPRQVCVTLFWAICGTCEKAAFIAGMDHSNLVYARKAVINKANSDADFCKRYKATLEEVGLEWTANLQNWPR